jgi:flagellum-specific peptidoglycan hydrolase FlgJ
MRNPLIFIFVLSLFFLSATKESSTKFATPANAGKYSVKPRPEHVEKYVNRFLNTAMSEAEKYNIPVSIKLAQGILESNAGRSELSRKHNNHFGMKWHKGRNEKYTVYRDDTPRDRFVVYKSAWRSYRDHSKLLSGYSRYSHLTKLKRTQYKKWAYGLKRAGYATSPRYAESLINVIETYDLWVYDTKHYIKRHKNKNK